MTLVGQEHFLVRDDVIALLPSLQGRVLDVGCGPGLTAAALLRRGVDEVWGVERDPALAATALAAGVTHVHTHDLEGDPLGELPRAYFDAILYADVLEHLIDPWSVLQAQRALLAPAGRIVVSLPNVRNLRVVLPLLLRGRWDYTTEGLLSRGHLRFFTTWSMRSMIRGAGYTIEEERAVYAPRGLLVSRLSLGALDDLVTRQRIFRAVALPSTEP